MENGLPVALVYDFDGTLSAGNMQEYEFIPAIGKSSREFWMESNEMALEQDADPILAYMYRMLHEARSQGLSLRKEAFMALGASITLFDGVLTWFDRINAYARERGIQMNHYINSSGLREMIEGTPIARHFRKIYACSFLYDVDGVAYWPAVAVNYTNKTQFIFKINKGVESVYDSHDVNKFVPEEDRPIPFRRMIYVGDGTTDIPSMRLVKHQGGHSIAVYKPDSKSGQLLSEKLVKDNRASYVCPADYSQGSPMELLVKTILDKIEADHKLAVLSSRPKK